MARIFKNECVGCPTEMGCLGTMCPYQNVEYLICDECEDSCDILYDYDGEELCEECLLNRFPKIKL